ncbi:MAG: DUF559 domain-containing protein [Solirubrobacterales bacterium]
MDPAGADPLGAVLALARSQYWVVARWQLVRPGFGGRRIESWLAVGRLHRLHHGVYAYGRRDVPARGRWLAAVLACGDGALLSHTSAGGLHGITPTDRRLVHVTSRRHARRADSEIAHHRTRSLHRDDIAVVGGIPVTSVSRTLVDLAAVLDADRVRDAFEEADRLNLLELGPLAAACARGRGRRGVGTLRTLIAEATAPEPTRGEFELRFRHFCRAHSLPLPRANAEVLGYTVDALWPEARLIVELDSWEHHGKARSAFEIDRQRDVTLLVGGYRVFRLTWRRLHREPGIVAGELRALLDSAAATPDGSG